MRHRLLFKITFLLLIFKLAIMLPIGTFASDGIQWESYQKGVARGKAEKKKVFLSFYADWCQYCKIMEKETFQNSTVIAYINRNFIPIKVNSDKNKKTAIDFNITGLPSTWFLSEKGDRIGNRPGFIPAKEMLSLLKYIQSDSYLKMTFNTFLEEMSDE
jgi:thioredoxin-related protein